MTKQTKRLPIANTCAVFQAADLPLSRLSAVADDLSEGTSGYDSACSDELSERERRLGRLRRMAGDLEGLLSPAGAAWSDITNVRHLCYRRLHSLLSIVDITHTLTSHSLLVTAPVFMAESCLF